MMLDDKFLHECTEYRNNEELLIHFFIQILHNETSTIPRIDAEKTKKRANRTTYNVHLTLPITMRLAEKPKVPFLLYA